MSCRLLMRRWILVATALLPACAGSTELEPGELTEAEAAALAEAALFATLNSTSALPPRPDAGAEEAAWALAFEAEVRCPLGGGVVLAAELVVGGSVGGVPGTASYRLREVHEGCSAGTLADGRLALDGAPRVDVSTQVVRDGEGRVSWSGASAGRIRWRTGARRGECDLDVTFDAIGSEGRGGHAILRGVVCGHALEPERATGS